MDIKFISITYAQPYEDGITMCSKILQVNNNDFNTVIKTLKAIQDVISDDYFYFVACDDKNILKI